MICSEFGDLGKNGMFSQWVGEMTQGYDKVNQV